MAITLESKIIMDKVNEWLTEDIQDIAIELVNNLKRDPENGGTPRDTGWAANNWIVAIRRPPKKPIGERPESGTFGETDSGIAALLTWEVGKGDVFVVNNVPYIEPLNQKGGKRGGPFFVEKSIDKALSKVL